MNLFVASPFFHRTQLTHKTNFKRIFAATILRFHDAFLGIFGNEPSGKYKDPTHLPFHHKIISVLAETKNLMENFRKWQDEVITGFTKTNWLVVDVSKVGQGSAKMNVNSRCVVRLIE